MAVTACRWGRTTRGRGPGNVRRVLHRRRIRHHFQD
jgi:hypothetical protein